MTRCDLALLPAHHEKTAMSGAQPWLPTVTDFGDLAPDLFWCGDADEEDVVPFDFQGHVLGQGDVFAGPEVFAL